MYYNCEGHFCCLHETKVFKKHTNVFFFLFFFFLYKCTKFSLSGRFRFRVIENAACTVIHYVYGMSPYNMETQHGCVHVCVCVRERERERGEISG